MKFSFSRLGTTIVISAAMMSACGGTAKNSDVQTPPAANAGSEPANSARTNVEELRLLVNIPFEPEDIDWKEDTVHKRVVAILRFSPEDSNKIVAEAAGFGPAENVSVANETWFPVELTAQSDVSGDSSLKGVAYPANQFFLDPYMSGKITRIEDGDYFRLELTAK
ncbi:hypothetical protein BH10ACI3_BH10ACI3_03720 [soil metagenome]